MFKQPLSTIQNPHPLLVNAARLPKPYIKRWGQSISNIANALIPISFYKTPAPQEKSNVDEECYYKYKTSKQSENIYPQQMGNVIEFIIACEMMDLESASVLYFPQACDHIDDLYFRNPNKPKRSDGRKHDEDRIDWSMLDGDRQQAIIDDLHRLNDLLYRIEADPMSEDGITAACQFVAFHNSFHQGRKRYSSDGKSNNLPMEKVTPTHDCALSIYKFAHRAITLLKRYENVQSYQFEFPLRLTRDCTNGVNGGRLDFVADNVIIDIKTNQSDITDRDKTQLLLYLAYMQRVQTNKPVNKAVIIDVRTGNVIEYDWRKLTWSQRRKLQNIIDTQEWNYFDSITKKAGVIEIVEALLKPKPLAPAFSTAIATA